MKQILILDKYLLKSIAKMSILVLVFFVFTFTFFKFLDELKEVGNGKYSLDISIQYILLLSPSTLGSVLTVGLMISVILVIGSMSSNKELQIYQIGTISPKNIIIKIVKYAVTICVLLIVFIELISPKTLFLAQNLKDQALGKTINVNTSETFWVKHNNNFILFDYKNSKENLTKVINFEISNNRLSELFTSNELIVTEEHILAKNPKKIRFDYSNNLTKIISQEPANENIEIFLNKDQINSLKTDVKIMTLFELFSAYIAALNNQLNSQEFLKEIIFRLIQPFTLAGMIIISLPFVYSQKRNTSIGKRIFVGIVIGITTQLVTKVFSVLSIANDSMEIWGTVLPSIVYILIGLFLLKKNFNY